MTVEHPLSRAKGKAGLFWAANHAGGPVKILDGDAPVLVFVNEQAKVQHKIDELFYFKPKTLMPMSLWRIRP